MPTNAPPSYFTLSQDEQAELLQGAIYSTPWLPKLLEKDIWVVWTLDALFRQPNAPAYAFKGGTSLSKVYGAIDRFSEDVDITLDPDHPTFIAGLDPLEASVSKTQLKKRGDRARAKLPEYLTETLIPSLELRALDLPRHARPTIALDPSKEGGVRVHYPSALEPSTMPPYVPESVLLEIGARGSTEPSHRASVHTYLSALPTLHGRLSFPTATVSAMSLIRTFWEKATLIHFEITRNDHATPEERYARHWYDLHALSERPDLVDQALAERATLGLVLHVKRTHYSGKGVRYEDCGAGRLRLTMNDDLRSQLTRDYGAMIASNMFVRSPPPFERIAARLAELEARINAHFEHHPVTPSGA